MASSSHHTVVAVQPPAGQYPGTHGTTSLVIGQPQQHFASSPNKFNSCYSRVSSILFGFLQIALFAFSIAGAIMVVINEGSGSELGTGFWCGTVYGVAGCLAAAGGYHVSKNMIIAVAVFSFLDIPFGIAAIVLSMDALLEEGDCNSDWCVIPNLFNTAGNAMVCVTGFWEVVFGLSLLIISIRALCIGSKSQVSSVPVYYSSIGPETVQLNPTTSLHADVTRPPTINGVPQTVHRTAEDNHYETMDHQKF